MFIHRGGIILAAIAATALGASEPPPPTTVRPNPPGLQRPSHLGAEWPHLEMDEKLYSLRFTEMRNHYDGYARHRVERRTPYPELEKQFQLTGYGEVAERYYGREPPETFQQTHEEHSASLTGATGLISIPSAFTQARGTRLVTVSYETSRIRERRFFPSLYDSGRTRDLRAALTYGLRDDVELTFVTNFLDRELNYVNGRRARDTGFVLFGGGFKLSFPLDMDLFQIAAGGSFTVFRNDDRDFLRIPEDYETMANLYLVISTESRLWNAHFMYKHVMYDYESGTPAPVGMIGGDPETGFSPDRTSWGVLGLGIEYKVPDWNLRFINEFEKTGYIDFSARKELAWNFAIQTNLGNSDLKAYGRQLNHGGYEEFGVLSTFRW